MTTEKQFMIRNSLLTDLFENGHIRTVYHLFIASFVGLFVNTVAYDYLKNGEIKFGMQLIKKGFRNLHFTLFGWTILLCMTFIAFLCFKIWARNRSGYRKNKKLQTWDLFWISILLGYYVLSFRRCSTAVAAYDLGPASALVLLIEQTRLLMKVHAFIRANIPKVIDFKPHDDKELILPRFSQFLYFLFVPTLLYRDEYPRTKQINWKFIYFRLLEIIAVIFYVSLVLDRFLNPTIQDFGKRMFTINEIILYIFENTITGILILLPLFFLILHSWQNLFAELTRFGDRMFYKDWWTCTDFGSYFRTWNVIVHEWLYVHVYREVEIMLGFKFPLIAKLSVFMVSAVVHEWILTYMLGFCFPLLFFQFFFIGSFLHFIRVSKTPTLNVVFWYALAFGTGSLIFFYAMEYYARLNAPLENPTFKDFFIPRFITCDCIEFY